MTDILERLRAEIDPDVNEPIDRLLDDAADEIGRLREECANLQYMENALEEKVAEMEDEIERLRQPALTSEEAADAMASCPYWNGVKSLTPYP
jgi:predicted  nucleic acid-binding Zn-ribbon protein